MACQSSTTIVVLMGLRKLRHIAKLTQLHRGKLEPMAIIQDATKADQINIIGNSSNIIRKFEQGESNAPGIIVIGKVVNYASLGLEIDKLATNKLAG